MKKHLLSSLLLLIGFLAVYLCIATPTFAQGITNPVIGELGSDPQEAATGSTFQLYFIFIWQALITVGGLLVLIYFIWGAIEWIVAGGDSGKIQKARDKIVQSIIGLIVLVGSFVIIGWVSAVFFGENFDILRLQFNDPRNSGTPGLNAVQRGVNGLNNGTP